MEEFVVQMPITLGYEGGGSPLPMRETWDIFGLGSSSSATLKQRNRKALEDLKNNARQVEELIQIRNLHLPPAILELSSVVQYVAIRYLQNLPLGVREDILADFMDPHLSPETAFRRMFEKTGNEKLGQFLGLLKGAMPDRFQKVLKEFRGNVK